MYSNLSVAVVTILKKINKILLLKRKNTPWINGFWGLPRGRLESGEYFRLTEILKIKSCGISEIIYSKEKFEEIYSWKIKDFMNLNNIIY